ncbi:hypothetical protein [Desertibaculum subflavum]|uniref:hypothetical protein n=1 Tax=Desertibaculum subflavum TaxID=2268458 RepID=UPI0013C41F57
MWRWGGLPLAAALACMAAAALALPLEIQTFPSGRYVSGGVGSDEQAQMERLRDEFNLRILTARRKSGEFLADARVTIMQRGRTVLETVMTGPLMLVELPPGSYAVRVEVEGKPIDQTVVIEPRDGRELYLYWD